MAWLGALGSAAGGTAAGAGATAAGAGAAGSTAAGLGTAGGLGLGGAAATPALSLAGGSSALGAGIPAIGAGSSGLTAAGLGGGGISTAGGIAPQLMQGASQPWYSQMFSSAKEMGQGYGQKQGNDKAGGKKQPDLVADAPIGSVRERPRYDASGSNAQIAAILQSIFGANV